MNAAYVAAIQEISEEWERAQNILADYAPFGLSYSCDVDDFDGGLSMTWQGKPVHSIYDSENGSWIANSLRGEYLGSYAVDLEAVYNELGELTGLRELQK